MTEEQKEFYSDIKEVSRTMADWVEAKFEAGFSVTEVKRYIRDAAKACGRD